MLLMAILTLNNRDIAISLSPFFLTYGYHADPVDQAPDPEKRASNYFKRLREGQEYAQAAMASIQQ